MCPEMSPKNSNAPRILVLCVEKIVGMRSESMIHYMRGVLHLRYLCYIHERDADLLVVTTVGIESSILTTRYKVRTRLQLGTRAEKNFLPASESGFANRGHTIWLSPICRHGKVSGCSARDT